MTQHVRCLLCGAKMTACELLDACSVMVAPELPALGARCPSCQGYFEVHPTPGGIETGYHASAVAIHFQAVQQLSLDTLIIDNRGLPERLLLMSELRRWEFAAGNME